MRVLLNTASSSHKGEMKTGERNDAAIMTTLPYDDIGSEENHKHHLPVDQVQCAKRFWAGTECGEMHIELTGNVCDVIGINIGHTLHIEEERHCITRTIEKWMQLS